VCMDPESGEEVRQIVQRRRSEIRAPAGAERLLIKLFRDAYLVDALPVLVGSEANTGQSTGRG
ncbi:MAG: hypothetical protein N2512_07970, partial [Armatimonadetes bacterium]|nr:hypothetical protein [Armatimonadota bacterium]